jgi:hypothetical protein
LLIAMGVAAAEHIGVVGARTGTLFQFAHGQSLSRMRSLLAPSRTRAAAVALGLVVIAIIPRGWQNSR